MRWSQHDPDAALVAALAAALVHPPDPGDAYDRLERIGAWERVISWAHAAQAGEITDHLAHAEDTARAAHDPDGPRRPLHVVAAAAQSAEAEIQLMLHLSSTAAGRRVADALQWQAYPPTMTAFGRGLLTPAKVRIITDALFDLDHDQALRVQAAILPAAPTRTTGQLHAALRRAVLLENPDTPATRRRRTERTRSVVLRPAPDGMATLTAYLPAAAATGIWAVLDQHARACPATDHRTHDARRADVLTDLVLRDTGLVSSGTHTAMTTTASPDARHSNPGSSDTGSDTGPGGAAIVHGIMPAPTGGSPFAGNRIQTRIRVTVSYDALRGTSDEPAELAGYGPIPAADARELAADPTSIWERLITDPVTGGPLELGTTRYRPPRSLSDFVCARSRYCQFPGCRVPAHRCDFDHTVPFDPDTGTGPTDAANGGPKCRPHHRLKAHPGWTVEQYPDGTTDWHTPSGHTYRSEPTRLPGTRSTARQTADHWTRAAAGRPGSDHDDDPAPF